MRDCALFSPVLLGTALASLCGPVPALGQANEVHSHFEAASIRPVQGDAPDTYIGPETGDLSRVIISKTTLRDLIAGAYRGDGLKRERISGPLWVEKQYSLEATIPAGSTPEDARRMMQNLLAERFGLKFHFENREVQGFEMIISPRGFKLTPSKAKAASPPSDTRAPVRPGRDSIPGSPGRALWSVDTYDEDSGTQKLSFHQCSIGRLAGMLSLSYGRRAVPIVDKTGIEGVFDFHLLLPIASYAGPPGAGSPSVLRRPADSSDSSIADLRSASAALEKQIGLKLEPIKQLFRVMVIDSLARTPTAN
jgi:uncharacterized protein (TIGR03435 family)